MTDDKIIWLSYIKCESCGYFIPMQGHFISSNATQHEDVIKEQQRILQGLKVLELVEKRLHECMFNSNKLNFQTQWKEYKFQEDLIPELQQILEESKYGNE